MSTVNLIGRGLLVENILGFIHMYRDQSETAFFGLNVRL